MAQQKLYLNVHAFYIRVSKYKTFTKKIIIMKNDEYSYTRETAGVNII